jgi:ectoine hydroxylase
MTPDQILGHPPIALEQEQRKFFFEQGYLVLDGYLSAPWRERLRAAMDTLRERSKQPEGLSSDFEFEDDPAGGPPRLRQVLCAPDYHDDLWAYASQPPQIDIVADLVGPDVKFREANVAYKPVRGGGFKWHQDVAFFPHSNMALLMVLTFLDDVTPDQGPTMVVPGSHRGEVYDHFGADGRWLGVIAEGEAARAPIGKAVDLTGPAGTLAILDCGILHGARRNESGRERPVVINGYSAADSVPYAAIPYHSRYRWEIVRVKPARYVHSEDLRLKMPPDWSMRARYHESRMDNALSKAAS